MRINVAVRRRAVTRANEIITLARFATRTKGLAPNIIDFPSYRVILRSLSEQYYEGAQRYK